MTVYHLPNSDFPYTKLYEKPPQKNVLLLSCMDIRLLDNTAKFMDELNLQNRYDHVIFAGAGLGAGKVESKGEVEVECEKEGKHKRTVDFKWSYVFFDHLSTAITKLKREIKDIFILEHLDCGAYKYFQKNSQDNTDYEQFSYDRRLDRLEHYHEIMANEFADEIDKYCKQKADKYAKANPDAKKSDNPWDGIKVHCLIMDLTGRVKDLPRPTIRTKPTKLKKAKNQV